jgi:hypothetical protein
LFKKAIAFRADASPKGHFAGLAENGDIDTGQSLDEIWTKPTFECQRQSLLTPLGLRSLLSPAGTADRRCSAMALIIKVPSGHG